MALIHELKSQGEYLFKNRGILPLLILVPALLLYVFDTTSSHYSMEPWHDSVKFIGLVTSLFGLALRAHVIGHVAPNTSGRNTSVGQKADIVNRTGLYSLVRHPLYVGNFFMWLGPALWTMNFWFIAFFIVLYYLYYERIMFAEERYLEEKFGNLYMDWAAERPAFTPKSLKYISADSPFNWRKVVRQERSGFLATFLVFWVFYTLSNVIHNGWQAILEINIWSVMFLCALVIFLILKSLKGHPILKDRP